MTTTGQMLSDTQVAKRFTGRGKNGTVHTSTIVRLILNGAKGADGVRRRLKAARVGQKWYVSEADLAEFLELQSRLPDDEAQPVTPAERRRLDEAASRKLTELLAK